MGGLTMTSRLALREVRATERVAIGAPIDCPTRVNSWRSFSESMVCATAATCSASVYSACPGIGDSPNPSKSMVMHRWVPSSSGSMFWNVTDDEATRG